MAIQNRLTEVLGIAHPVLLAPMDLVSGGKLAAVVSQAGGLGLLGGGYGDRDWIEREWGRAGNTRIGCGFITWSLAKHPELLDRTLAHRPAAIMLSFGDPRPFAPAIHAAGARLICQVQTVAQARAACVPRRVLPKFIDPGNPSAASDKRPRVDFGFKRGKMPPKRTASKYKRDQSGWKRASTLFPHETAGPDPTPGTAFIA